MQFHPLFEYVCKKLDIYRAFVWIGSYGGGSPKPTFFYSNYAWVQELYLPLPTNTNWEADMSIKYIDRQGVARVTGGSELKVSQHYPALLGDAVAQLYDQHRPEIKKAVVARRLVGSVKLQTTNKNCYWSFV
ncbi:unnamed protein product [Durusdinium trenchii]|uniref:Uncharacterized protein n=1 Tax=Durusdinium trenchii TaxID=1381693 RepID=A0ABP0MFS6_9DINO